MDKEVVSIIKDSLQSRMRDLVSSAKKLWKGKACSKCGDKYLYKRDKSWNKGELYCALCMEDDEPGMIISAWEYHLKKMVEEEVK